MKRTALLHSVGLCVTMVMNIYADPTEELLRNASVPQSQFEELHESSREHVSADGYSVRDSISREQNFDQESALSEMPLGKLQELASTIQAEAMPLSAGTVGTCTIEGYGFTVTLDSATIQHALKYGVPTMGVVVVALAYKCPDVLLKLVAPSLPFM